MTPSTVDRVMAKVLAIYGDRAERSPHREALQRVRAYVSEEPTEEAAMVSLALGLSWEKDFDILEAQVSLMALVNLEHERRSPGRFSQDDLRKLRSKVLPSLWECIQE